MKPTCRLCPCGRGKRAGSPVCARCRVRLGLPKVCGWRPADIEERIARLRERAERGLSLFEV